MTNIWDDEEDDEPDLDNLDAEELADYPGISIAEESEEGGDDDSEEDQELTDLGEWAMYALE